MPTDKEILDAVGAENKDALEMCNNDPRMFLTIQVMGLKALAKKKNQRFLTGELGSLVPTYQTNEPCSYEELEFVKESLVKVKNYAALLKDV